MQRSGLSGNLEKMPGESYFFTKTRNQLVLAKDEK